MFGIDHVLVCDFDEFLYCPSAGPRARSQAQYIRQFISDASRMGYEQMMIPQRFVVNKTASPRDCIIEKVKNGSSLFDCYSAYRNYMGGHSVKSIHLGHHCPLTGYHQACPGPDGPRAYDCVCTNKYVKPNPWRPYENLPGRECAMVHLSTNSEAYKADRYVYNPKDRRDALDSVSELWTVSHDGDDVEAL